MRELTVFPLPGGTYRKSSGYGMRTNPVTGKAGTMHRGVDYAVATGVTLFAPFDGIVTTGNQPGGAGLWINVTAGGDQFRSFHHSRYQVTSGSVKAGDVIAYIGTTGSSTGPHAHLELWENGVNIDPTGYLDRAPLKGTEPKTEEEEEVKSYIIWSDAGDAFQVWGIFRRHLSPADLKLLKYLGVQDLGKNQAFIDATTEVPRGSIAGEG